MNVLERIFARKREQLSALEAEVPLAQLKARAADAQPVRPFRRALEQASAPVSLIAEVKKASPVKGVIREDFDPVTIARAYEMAGAQCLSVLTDVEFFQGSPDFLVDCRAATNLPVLRKDFTTSEYHVWEARAMGSDAILLIVNGLSKSDLTDFRELGESLGMDVLVEAHTLEEAETAFETGATFIGINNRDLETFEVSIDVACQVIPELAGRATVVSESALKTHEDVGLVGRAGARAVLIGTTFCKSPDVGAKVREVMGW
ncbi:MAG: indole-3-glycerol phosphate synthase TrpC [Armatimonadetes bacterium]|nr:indole-3-glycerol phosphate synthase TrpC [Armatimonadota bacterium]